MEFALGQGKILVVRQNKKYRVRINIGASTICEIAINSFFITKFPCF